jgi:hypothetical protein
VADLKINSLVVVVVAQPLLAVLAQLDVPASTSSGLDKFNPPYSRI